MKVTRTRIKMRWIDGLVLIMVIWVGSSCGDSALSEPNQLDDPSQFLDPASTLMIGWGQRISFETPRPPGNSLPTVDLAYDLGYDGIELDVRMTQDLVPILMHDRTIDSTTNGTGFVRDLTFGQLESLTLGDWQGQPVRIPSLSEALLVNGARGRVLLDMRIHVEHVSVLKRAVQRVGFDESLLDVSVYSISDGADFVQYFPAARIFVKKYINPDELTFDFVDAVADAGLAGIMIQVPLWDEPIADIVTQIHNRGLEVVLFVHGGWPRIDADEYLDDSLQSMVDAGADAVLTTRHDLVGSIEP